VRGFFYFSPCMQLICFNGTMLKKDEPVFPVSNRGFKYGDGVFETMKLDKGQLQLAALHFDRLFASLELLQIPAPFSSVELTERVEELCRVNGCRERARVRLAVYRSENGEGEYCIEAVALPEEKTLWNERGWSIDIYPYARKGQDVFANLKTANYLPYVMADRYATERGLDEALVLNSHGHLCDASKANLFLIKEDSILTPALHQGCVNGVMRRYVSEEAKRKGYTVKQAEVTLEDLLGADEVFLTNALQGIKWVARFRDKQYGHEQTRRLYDFLF
jgi:branched-chain amino acid aminotransferase